MQQDHFNSELHLSPPNVINIPKEINLNAWGNCSPGNLAVIDAELQKYIHFCSENYDSRSENASGNLNAGFHVGITDEEGQEISSSTVTHNGYN